MPSFPPPDTVTICEINRDLITADSLSDDRAKECYGKALGVVFNPVQFQPENLISPTSDDAGDQQRGVPEKGLPALIGAVKRIFHPNDFLSLADAFVARSQFTRGIMAPAQAYIGIYIWANQVTIRDYDDTEGKDPSILHGDFQREVKLVEWRPNSGRTLSVACKGGICLWAASYPGNPASVRSGATPFVGSISKGSGTRWTLVDFLKSDEHISALSWSPDGRYLATGSFESSAFTIWDVSQGEGTPFRRGWGGVSILRWSPTGDYFFAAMFDGTFYLWETGTWTSQPWSSSRGFVTGATWDPDGRMILLAFSNSSSLGSVHFASKPPSLVAHLLPVDLPEITTLTGSQQIEKIAWDASGERLAISFKEGDELYRGLIAIYDVRRTPLIAASLVGFIRGPGDNAKAIAFSFYNKFKQGPLLSVCWSSGYCCTYPLLFRSHILP